jgi:hypothetical protein
MLASLFALQEGQRRDLSQVPLAAKSDRNFDHDDARYPAQILRFSRHEAASPAAFPPLQCRSWSLA